MLCKHLFFVALATLLFFKELNGECESFDEPDFCFLDENCDGIDGNIQNSVFVDSSYGDNSNNGTIVSIYKIF